MRIISYSKEISYIDTLELYYNFLSKQDYIESLKKLEPLGKLGEAGGYAWFRFPNYRLGVIIDYDRQKLTGSNYYDVIIQYENKYLYYLGLNLDGIELPFSKSKSDYIYRRVDFAKIVKSDIDYTYGFGYVSGNWRQHPFKYGRTGETTIYLGDRRKGHTLRIYNKSKELKEKKDYEKATRLRKVFGDIENLYNFEYEFRRQYLRLWQIHTLKQHKELIEFANYLLSNIYLIEDTPVNRKLVDSNNYDDIDNKIYIQDYNGVPPKKPKRDTLVKDSLEYFYSLLKGKIDRFIDNTSIPAKTIIDYLTVKLYKEYLPLSSLPPSPSPRLSVLGAIKLE